MKERAMLHITPANRDRLNQLAAQEGITQQAMLIRLLDTHQPPTATPAIAHTPQPPTATPAIVHTPLLVYGKGAALCIDSKARPYIRVDGHRWQRLEFGAVVPPWE